MDSNSERPLIAVAGANGNLGSRILEALLHNGATVVALVRRTPAHLTGRPGIRIIRADYSDPLSLSGALQGVSCVVSALSGLRDVIVDAQSGLLEAAVTAGVPRFIPSDYSLDFTKLPPGSNRNFDLRREFHTRLNQAPIAATTVFNGAFTDMLTDQMPLILFRLRRVLYWSNPDQLMDFTTMNDTARFTARAALDSATPRFLRVAGDQLSARQLAMAAGQAEGRRFGLLRAGSLTKLSVLIRIARLLSPGGAEVYPAWQGMQYMHNMFEGRAKLRPLDNGRYPELRWESVLSVLRREVRGRSLSLRK